MGRQSKGKLIIIGGHEDKDGDADILKAVVESANGGDRIVLVTAASQVPEELAKEYKAVFRKLGIKSVDVLDIRTREDAYNEAQAEPLKGAGVIFSLVTTS